MIASENAHAHHRDRNRILRWQEKFSMAGCRKGIVNVNRRKSIRITVPRTKQITVPLAFALFENSFRRKDRIAPMRAILLLTISNLFFMTFAGYGHLKYREVPLYKVMVVSWLIAFLEYCFQVPANRISSYDFTAAQLKTIQEVIRLTVFVAFSVIYLRQPLRELPGGVGDDCGGPRRDLQEWPGVRLCS
jgi:uncharacterized protein (DUF486 family)